MGDDAATTPVLGLQLLLGLRPDQTERQLVTDAPSSFPAWAGQVDVRGVPAFGGTWDVHAEPRGNVTVERA